MNYCSQCGAQTLEQDIYCEQCGNKLDKQVNNAHKVVGRKKPKLFGREEYQPQAPPIDPVPNPYYWGGSKPLLWWSDPQTEDYKYEGRFMRAVYWIIDLITGPVTLEPVRTVPVYEYPIPAKCSSCGWHGDWNTAPSAAYGGDGFKGKLCPLCGERLI